MKPLTAEAQNFMQMLAGSTAKEASLLIKYARDEELLAFRDGASECFNEDPLPEMLIPFRESVDALRATRSATDVRQFFLGTDAPTHTPPTPLEFFTDLADATEREGGILMRWATEKHLYALRDAAMELLLGRVALSANQDYALEPFWAEIRELALARSAKDISKVLFQHFQGRLLLLQGIVIPSLTYDDA